MADGQPPSAPQDEATSLVPTVGPGRQRKLKVTDVLDLLRKATLGEYDVAGELGKGGMATVYLAHDLSLDRKVAIKVMSPELVAVGDTMVDRFIREARTGARLSHPNIIPIYAVRETEDLLFFVMKYIEGKPLDDIIRVAGPLPFPLVRKVIMQVADALAYAHRNGIIHRDIKPANMMVDKDGWIILTDLGIAKVMESSSLTSTGSTVGTPAYMSPEQADGSKEIGGASDQYSLGIVAYEMLVGKPPFEADTVMALMWKHHTEPPPPLLEGRPDAPADLVDAISRMLQKKPAERFASMEDVVAAFRGSEPIDDEEVRAMIRAYVSGDSAAAQRYATPRSSEVLKKGSADKTVLTGSGGTAQRPAPTVPTGRKPAAATLVEQASAPAKSGSPMVLIGGAVVAAAIVGGALILRGGKASDAPAPGRVETTIDSASSTGRSTVPAIDSEVGTKHVPASAPPAPPTTAFPVAAATPPAATPSASTPPATSATVAKPPTQTAARPSSPASSPRTPVARAVPQADPRPAAGTEPPVAAASRAPTPSASAPPEAKASPTPPPAAPTTAEPAVPAAATEEHVGRAMLMARNARQQAAAAGVGAEALGEGDQLLVEAMAARKAGDRQEAVAKFAKAARAWLEAAKKVQ